jgi:oligopeptide/dipeptide ABC transporter ATP-binding protein
MYRGQIMEYGPTEELFENPCHPYTLALLSAVPDPESAIGRHPDSSDFGESERRRSDFKKSKLRGRCPGQTPCSRDKENLFVDIGNDHFVRCWETGEKDFAASTAPQTRKNVSL